jgi:hypothetical protein
MGADVTGGALTRRYPHDEDNDVRLLTETLVAELVAARAWVAAGSGELGSVRVGRMGPRSPLGAGRCGER